MLMVGNCILGCVRYIRNVYTKICDFTRPYIFMAYDCMGIHYPTPVIGGEPWHLFVSMTHPDVGDIPVHINFENALNNNIPEKTNALICKYAEIPITTDLNIDDIVVEVMNGDGVVSSFRGDDIINRF